LPGGIGFIFGRLAGTCGCDRLQQKHKSPQVAQATCGFFAGARGQLITNP
jgi:hypothetical protein